MARSCTTRQSEHLYALLPPRSPLIPQQLDQIFDVNAFISFDQMSDDTIHLVFQQDLVTC